jgi:hypothetical protein
MSEQRELIAVLEKAPEELRSLSRGASWEPLLTASLVAGARRVTARERRLVVVDS